MISPQKHSAMVRAIKEPLARAIQSVGVAHDRLKEMPESPEVLLLQHKAGAIGAELRELQQRVESLRGGAAR